jgi:hypothetical protein
MEQVVAPRPAAVVPVATALRAAAPGLPRGVALAPAPRQRTRGSPRGLPAAVTVRRSPGRGPWVAWWRWSRRRRSAS